MTRTPLSRSKDQGHQAALLSAALTRKAAAAVSVRTYSARESTARLLLLGGARGAWAPTGERGGRLTVSPRAQLLTAVNDLAKCGYSLLSETYEQWILASVHIGEKMAYAKTGVAIRFDKVCPEEMAGEAPFIV